MEELFAAPGVPWHRVSPRLALVRRALVGAAALVVTAVAVVLALTGRLPAAALVTVLVVVALASAWAWWLVARSARRWGYAELDRELYITRGAFLRRLVAVPYSRMQYVDVHSGPADQLAGIATVRLHTAAPGTSAVIPGLPAHEAARLRDRLTARSDGPAGL